MAKADDVSKSGFADLPPELRDPQTASIAVLPVPYDETSTWRKGADRGPRAIIEASRYLELYDIETDSEVCGRGIATLPEPKLEQRPEAMVRQVEKAVSELLARDLFPVVLGGEHSVTAGAVAAFAGVYDDLSVLQLDAHTDLRETYEGSRYNHACVMARVREICPILQVGIRSMDRSELANAIPGRVFYARDIVGEKSWIGGATQKLTPHVYITLDLDVFDPAYMPATGTPEPGGLDWYAVTALLSAVCKHRSVVGFDIVELCPEENPAPDFLAAKLTYKLLSYIFRGHPETHR
jgi:agmatinase